MLYIGLCLGIDFNDEGFNFVIWYYLMVQVWFNFGQFEVVQDDICEVVCLEGFFGDLSYGVVFVQGQVLSYLG